MSESEIKENRAEPETAQINQNQSDQSPQVDIQAVGKNPVNKNLNKQKTLTNRTQLRQNFPKNITGLPPKKKFVPTKVVPFSFNRPIHIQHKKFVLKYDRRKRVFEYNTEKSLPPKTIRPNVSRFRPKNVRLNQKPINIKKQTKTLESKTVTKEVLEETIELDRDDLSPPEEIIEEKKTTNVILPKRRPTYNYSFKPANSIRGLPSKKKFVPTKAVPFNFNRLTKEVHKETIELKKDENEPQEHIVEEKKTLNVIIPKRRLSYNYSFNQANNIRGLPPKKRFVPTKAVPFNFNRPVHIDYKKFKIKYTDRRHRRITFELKKNVPKVSEPVLIKRIELKSKLNENQHVPEIEHFEDVIPSDLENDEYETDYELDEQEYDGDFHKESDYETLNLDTIKEEPHESDLMSNSEFYSYFRKEKKGLKEQHDLETTENIDEDESSNTEQGVASEDKEEHANEHRDNKHKNGFKPTKVVPFHFSLQRPKEYSIYRKKNFIYSNKHSDMPELHDEDLHLHEEVSDHMMYETVEEDEKLETNEIVDHEPISKSNTVLEIIPELEKLEPPKTHENVDDIKTLEPNKNNLKRQNLTENVELVKVKKVKKLFLITRLMNYLFTSDEYGQIELRKLNKENDEEKFKSFDQNGNLVISDQFEKTEYITPVEQYIPGETNRGLENIRKQKIDLHQSRIQNTNQPKRVFNFTSGRNFKNKSLLYVNSRKKMKTVNNLESKNKFNSQSVIFVKEEIANPKSKFNSKSNFFSDKNSNSQFDLIENLKSPTSLVQPDDLKLGSDLASPPHTYQVSDVNNSIYHDPKIPHNNRKVDFESSSDIIIDSRLKSKNIEHDLKSKNNNINSPKSHQTSDMKRSGIEHHKIATNQIIDFNRNVITINKNDPNLINGNEKSLNLAKDLGLNNSKSIKVVPNLMIPDTSNLPKSVPIPTAGNLNSSNLAQPDLSKSLNVPQKRGFSLTRFVSFLTRDDKKTNPNDRSNNVENLKKAIVEEKEEDLETISKKKAIQDLSNQKKTTIEQKAKDLNLDPKTKEALEQNKKLFSNKPNDLNSKQISNQFDQTKLDSFNKLDKNDNHLIETEKKKYLESVNDYFNTKQTIDNINLNKNQIEPNNLSKSGVDSFDLKKQTVINSPNQIQNGQNILAKSNFDMNKTRESINHTTTKIASDLNMENDDLVKSKYNVPSENQSQFPRKKDQANLKTINEVSDSKNAKNKALPNSNAVKSNDYASPYSELISAKNNPKEISNKYRSINSVSPTSPHSINKSLLIQFDEFDDGKRELLEKNRSTSNSTFSKRSDQAPDLLDLDEKKLLEEKKRKGRRRLLFWSLLSLCICTSLLLILIAGLLAGLLTQTSSSSATTLTSSTSLTTKITKTTTSTTSTTSTTTTTTSTTSTTTTTTTTETTTSSSTTPTTTEKTTSTTTIETTTSTTTTDTTTTSTSTTSTTNTETTITSTSTRSTTTTDTTKTFTSTTSTTTTETTITSTSTTSTTTTDTTITFTSTTSTTTTDTTITSTSTTSTTTTDTTVTSTSTTGTSTTDTTITSTSSTSTTTTYTTITFTSTNSTTTTDTTISSTSTTSTTSSTTTTTRTTSSSTTATTTTSTRTTSTSTSTTTTLNLLGLIGDNCTTSADCQGNLVPGISTTTLYNTTYCSNNKCACNSPLNYMSQVGNPYRCVKTDKAACTNDIECWTNCNNSRCVGNASGRKK